MSLLGICEELKIQKFQQFSQNNAYSSYQGPVSIALVLLDSESNFLTTRLEDHQNRQVPTIILDIFNKMLMVLTTMIPEGFDGRGINKGCRKYKFEDYYLVVKGGYSPRPILPPKN
jgi:hypothetical protein